MILSRKNFLRGLGAAGVAAAVGLSKTEASARRPVTMPPWPAKSPVGSDAFWTEVQDQFPITDQLVYLNCGGLGPSPRPVLDAFDETARRLQDRVETGHFHFEESRVVLARFLGAKTDEICFTRNTTEGNGIIASGLNLKAGDEVIFESHAHPGGSLPWLNEARQRGIVVKVFRPDENSAAANLELINSKITVRTKVIQISHITAPTGILLPAKAIAKLAREKNIWFHVDGAQSAGMIPINVHDMDCDSYATSGHKWMGGPRETGVLYIRGSRIAEIAPRHVGAYSSADFDFQGQLNYTEGARRHEYGTRSAASVVALAAAVEFQEAIGLERIAAYGATLSRHVQDGISGLKKLTVLSPTEPSLRSSMVTFSVEGQSAAKMFGYLLDKHGFRCRPVTEAGLDALRISTHIFSRKKDCDRLIEAIASYVAQV